MATSAMKDVWLFIVSVWDLPSNIWKEMQYFFFSFCQQIES